MVEGHSKRGYSYHCLEDTAALCKECTDYEELEYRAKTYEMLSSRHYLTTAAMNSMQPFSCARSRQDCSVNDHLWLREGSLQLNLWLLMSYHKGEAIGFVYTPIAEPSGF